MTVVLPLLVGVLYVCVSSLIRGYRGLELWTFIGVGWLLHTVWDMVHHLLGHPIIPFAHASSLGCATCDPVIALCCLAGGPSVTSMLRTQNIRRRSWLRRASSSS